QYQRTAHRITSPWKWRHLKSVIVPSVQSPPSMLKLHDFCNRAPRFINTDKAPAYGRALALLKREGRCPSDVEHRQIKYRNNVIECDHGKLKRIIGATLGFKSMKTAYATIKGIEVMRALRKGQASAFYYGDPLGEMRLVSRVFEM
ncbi:DDE-type integrase/transposase/recombinase, partial [Pseudomonas aeruginosa]|uniref:DDE-type integrase/transposase/recombinase n=1 Tax=Pseudomonas aeruginosa TaxID=287 RepID=UPI004053D935